MNDNKILKKYRLDKVIFIAECLKYSLQNSFIYPKKISLADIIQEISNTVGGVYIVIKVDGTISFFGITELLKIKSTFIKKYNLTEKDADLIYKKILEVFSYFKGECLYIPRNKNINALKKNIKLILETENSYIAVKILALKYKYSIQKVYTILNKRKELLQIKDFLEKYELCDFDD